MRLTSLTRLLLLTGVILLVVGCKNNVSSSWKETNLLDHGFAVTVLAPADAEIKKSDLVFMQDLTIKGTDGYNMQIFMSDATTTDVAKVIADKKADVKSGQFFGKFVEEYDDGFIFEKDIEGHKNYDFRRIKIFGDKEYEFRAALIGNFTEDQVRSLYNAVTNK